MMEEALVYLRTNISFRLPLLVLALARLPRADVTVLCKAEEREKNINCKLDDTNLNIVFLAPVAVASFHPPPDRLHSLCSSCKLQVRSLGVAA